MGASDLTQVPVLFHEWWLTISYKLCLQNLRDAEIETRMNFCPKVRVQTIVEYF